jgi:hypothetical protein
MMCFYARMGALYAPIFFIHLQHYFPRYYTNPIKYVIFQREFKVL